MSAKPNRPPSCQSQAQIQPCRYRVGKTLGSGSYSVVRECVHIDTGRYYAAKVINKRLMAGREHMIRNEIAVLKKVSMGHQNILTLVDYFETVNNLYLVTDLALGGELFDRICRKGSYYESDAANVIRCTLSAVAYLHDHGIVHRDLKPENLLFRTPEDNSDLLIADFGLSRIIDEDALHVLNTTCGTPGYMAPEIFRKTGHGKPVDIWALGVIAYFLLCGYTPFDRDNETDEMKAILMADFEFHPAHWHTVSDDAKTFIRRCLTVDPARRMTALEALHHPFVATLPGAAGRGQRDLGPVFRKNFNARCTLHAAIDTVRAINKLREGNRCASTTDGSRSSDPGHDMSYDSTATATATATAASKAPNAAATGPAAAMDTDAPGALAAAAATAASPPPARYQPAPPPSPPISPYAPPPPHPASVAAVAAAAAAAKAATAAASRAVAVAADAAGTGDVDMLNRDTGCLLPPSSDSRIHPAASVCATATTTSTTTRGPIQPWASVPGSLRPGNSNNRVVETPAALWNSDAAC